jgi:hypothetical protein
MRPDEFEARMRRLAAAGPCRGGRATTPGRGRDVPEVPGPAPSAQPGGPGAVTVGLRVATVRGALRAGPGLVGGDPPYACKVVFLDQPAGFGHRVVDGGRVVEHVLTRHAEFEPSAGARVWAVRPPNLSANSPAAVRNGVVGSGFPLPGPPLRVPAHHPGA